MWWHQVTIFGDVIVTGPAALAILVWLLAGRLWRPAAAWIMLFGVGMLLVVVSKIAFIGWGIGSQSLDFTGLSGHAMRACAVMPVLAYLLAQGGAQRGWRIAGVIAGIGVGVLISVSRVMLHAHSWSEVISGGWLGVSVALLFINMASSHDKPAFNAWLLLASLLPLFWISRGEPAPTQQLLTRVALRLSGHQQPYTRSRWAPPVSLALALAQNAAGAEMLAAT